jgi:hypothetical protein
VQSGYFCPPQAGIFPKFQDTDLFSFKTTLLLHEIYLILEDNPNLTAYIIVNENKINRRSIPFGDHLSAISVHTLKRIKLKYLEHHTDLIRILSNFPEIPSDHKPSIIGIGKNSPPLTHSRRLALILRGHRG